MTAKGYTLGEISQRFDLALNGPVDRIICGVCTLDNGRENAIAFFADQKYKPALENTAAGAVILPANAQADCAAASLISSNPYLDYARIASLFEPVPAAQIHPRAIVADTAKIGRNVAIAAGAIIQEHVQIGDNVVIGANVCIESQASIGQGTRLASNVSVASNVVIGERCRIEPGAVIGSRGFGNARDGNQWVAVPQLGAVRIGNDVEIGANSTIDRGAIDDTVIGDGVKIDNLVHIAHNANIGAHTAIAAQVGISGSTEIGESCMIAGQVGFAGHLKIAPGSVILGGTAVTRSLEKPGMYGGVWVAEDAAQWRKTFARVRRLDKLEARVKQLEKNPKGA